MIKVLRTIKVLLIMLTVILVTVCSTPRRWGQAEVSVAAMESRKKLNHEQMFVNPNDRLLTQAIG